MPVNIGREMALPMEQIIGGPMQAIVKAQALSASTTVDFIQNVGLATDGENGLVARAVDFSFQRPISPDETDETWDESGVSKETVNLSVPILAIVPTPWIRVEEATIDFEAKVSSSTLSQSKSNFGVSASASGGFWTVNYSVKASYSRQSKFRDQVNRSSTISVHVKVVQDEQPAGLAKVLDILETAITDTTETNAQ